MKNVKNFRFYVYLFALIAINFAIYRGANCENCGADGLAIFSGLALIAASITYLKPKN